MERSKIFKRLTLFSVVAILSACAHKADKPDPALPIKAHSDLVDSLHSLQSKAISGKGDAKQIEKYSTDADRETTLFAYDCLMVDRANYPLLNYCESLLALTRTTSAGMMYSSGKYYADNGDKVAAKRVLREVVIRYKDRPTITKRAEFELEDLKQ